MGALLESPAEFAELSMAGQHFAAAHQFPQLAQALVEVVTSWPDRSDR